MELSKVAQGVAACALVFASAQAHAVFVQNTTAAAAGFTTTTTLDFTEVVLAAGASVTNEYAGYGVTFSPNLNYAPQFCTGYPNHTQPCLGNFSPTVVPWTIVFGSVQFEAGFNMVTNPNTTTFEALLANVVVDSAVIPTDTGSANNFYGFNGLAFDSIRVTTSGDGNMLMDNLTFNSNNVPEPASLALLGLGLLGLGASRRRS